ncbi:MAG: MazG-like family protein, partial [Clostridia bacterium]|nr:MazG-like family protein [Clostridia bacterium]
ACKGAPAGREDCSKEAALRALIEESGLKGEEIAVFGDGKVELALARAAGARAFGMATDEAARRGINARKRAKLIRAGADVIAGDFRDINGLFGLMGLNDARRTDETATVDFLRGRIMALVRGKGWGDPNGIQNPQHVAMAMTVEMSELLEHFQWLEEKQVRALLDGEDRPTLEGINEELADVFIYGLQLSKALHIDVADAILRKLEIVAGRDYSQEAPR